MLSFFWHFVKLLFDGGVVWVDIEAMLDDICLLRKGLLHSKQRCHCFILKKLQGCSRFQCPVGRIWWVVCQGWSERGRHSLFLWLVGLYWLALAYLAKVGRSCCFLARDCSHFFAPVLLHLRLLWRHLSHRIRYDALRCWEFHGKITWVDDVTENVGDLLAEDGVVGVLHVDHIKGYVFSTIVVLVAEGYW
jgi:hypothetical protein